MWKGAEDSKKTKWLSKTGKKAIIRFNHHKDVVESEVLNKEAEKI